MTDHLRSLPPLLEADGLTKYYGPVAACEEVNLALQSGEIHGILGENGAGKSTLMRMIFGLVEPDRGVLRMEGEVVGVTDPPTAVRMGIGMVHQHYSLVDALTVWENIALGESGTLDPDRTRARIRRISWSYGLSVDPDATVRDLSAGIRQRVEILKCLGRRPRIILLDEPTSALTPAESEFLFNVLLTGVRTQGWAVALVSHNLDEILRATDRITVMRNGRVVEQFLTAQARVPALAEAMVGRPVPLRTVTASFEEDEAARRLLETDHLDQELADPPPVPEEPSPPVLEIKNARSTTPDGRKQLDNLSLTVGEGEIVGVAGVEGNGQTALADLLAGLLRLDDGKVLVEGRTAPSGVAGAMTGAGIAVIPADRHRVGVVLGMSVAENLMLGDLHGMRNRGFLRREAIRQHALSLIDEYGIQTPGPDTDLGDLSGGNQQRTVIARALSSSPRVLVAHQPSRGLDVGAIEYVGDKIRAAAQNGIAILLLSTDLREILSLSDRVLVLHRGRVVGEMTKEEFDLDRLGLLMGGTEDRRQDDR
ncbi:MAG: ABC transporter ATP-binding protein [bacterium]|nr:ABC transporter ATP-binding protein [bacterium]